MRPAFSRLLVLYPGKMHGGDTQVRGDIVLWYPLDDVGPVLYKVDIALFRRIADTGEEFVHIMTLPLKGDLQQGFQEPRIFSHLVYHLGKELFGKHLYRGRLDRFYREYTGDILLKAFQGRNTLVLKKELNGSILSVVVEPKPETALFDKIIVLCRFTLVQQNGPGRKYRTLLQRGILIPKVIQVGEPLFKSEDHDNEDKKKAPIERSGLKCWIGGSFVPPHVRHQVVRALDLQRFIIIIRIHRLFG